MPLLPPRDRISENHPFEDIERRARGMIGAVLTQQDRDALLAMQVACLARIAQERAL